MHKNIERIAKLKKEINILSKEIRNEEEIAYKKIKPKYKIEVKKEIYKNFLYPDGLKGIRIILFLENKKDFQKHRNHFIGYTHFSNDNIMLRSIHYSRINNVCISNGGGTHLLKRNCIITDVEWKSILKGEIPEHLKEIIL